MNALTLMMCIQAFNVCNNLSIVQTSICMDYATDSCRLYESLYYEPEQPQQLQTGAIPNDKDRKTHSIRD